MDHTPSFDGASARYAARSGPNVRRRSVELALIFGFWGILAVLTAGGRIMDPWSEEVSTSIALRAVLRTFLQYLVWAVLTPFIFELSRRFSVDRANWPRHVAVHAAMAVLVAVTVDLYGDVLRYFVLPPASVPPFPFNPLRAVLRLWWINELIIFLAVLAAGFARDYFLRYQARQEEAAQLREHAARLEAQLTESRLQALRMQVNPHFLFNTLHAVSTLVERDPQGVRRMIARLSELLRYTLEGSTDPEVALRRELQFLDDYLEIQQIRFQGRLDVRRDVDPDVLDALVPNLILQPLVENAIKHGVSHVDGPGRLSICARREGDRLYLAVQDNGPGLAGDGISENERGFGLRSTRERLEGLYGDVHSLSFRTADDGGLIAEITLPYHTGADLRAVSVERP